MTRMLLGESSLTDEVNRFLRYGRVSRAKFDGTQIHMRPREVLSNESLTGFCVSVGSVVVREMTGEFDTLLINGAISCGSFPNLRFEFCWRFAPDLLSPTLRVFSTNTDWDQFLIELARG